MKLILGNSKVVFFQSSGFDSHSSQLPSVTMMVNLVSTYVGLTLYGLIDTYSVYNLNPRKWGLLVGLTLYLYFSVDRGGKSKTLPNQKNRRGHADKTCKTA